MLWVRHKGLHSQVLRYNFRYINVHRAIYDYSSKNRRCLFFESLFLIHNLPKSKQEFLIALIIHIFYSALCNVTCSKVRLKRRNQISNFKTDAEISFINIWKYFSHFVRFIDISVYFIFNIVVSRIRHFNPLNPELNPICYLQALLAHNFLHLSRIRVKLLTFRRLMSYIYIWSTHSWCF